MNNLKEIAKQITEIRIKIENLEDEHDIKELDEIEHKLHVLQREIEGLAWLEKNMEE